MDRLYTESLNGKEKELIKHTDSENVFKFGNGKKVKSLKMLSFTQKLAIKNVMIETDVVNEEVLLLLSEKTMKKADTH